jgi:hypothetical protein
LNHIKNLGDEISAGSPKFAMNYMKPASSSRNIPTSSKTDQYSSINERIKNAVFKVKPDDIAYYPQDINNNFIS